MMNIETCSGVSAFNEAINSIGDEQRIVVIGDDEARDLVEEQIEFSDPVPDELVSQSKSISGKDWLNQRIKEFIDDNDMELGDWPDQPLSNSDWTLNTDIFRKVHESVFVAKLKCASSWQIPAEFGFGGGNDCPLPEIHCAIWKYWEEKFEAHIVGMSHDVVEAKVLAPPKSKEDAMELAKQQYAYCSDIVDQGVGEIAKLGAVLIDCDKWYFWWD